VLQEHDRRSVNLAFAEPILPRASDLWLQASLDYKQRLEQLFFPEGVAFDGNRFNRTAVTAPLFNYLASGESADERVVSPVGIEPVQETRGLSAGVIEEIARGRSPTSRSSTAFMARTRSAWNVIRSRTGPTRSGVWDKSGARRRLRIRVDG
jgi:hypothetical protein